MASAKRTIPRVGRQRALDWLPRSGFGVQTSSGMGCRSVFPTRSRCGLYRVDGATWPEPTRHVLHDRGVRCPDRYDVHGHAQRAAARGGPQDQPRRGACLLERSGTLPYKPHIGTLSCSPEIDSINSLTPDNHGGNMDLPDMGPGSVTYLPVRSPGARVFIGDAHACQGDGEVAAWRSSIRRPSPSVST